MLQFPFRFLMNSRCYSVWYIINYAVLRGFQTLFYVTLFNFKQPLRSRVFLQISFKPPQKPMSLMYNMPLMSVYALTVDAKHHFVNTSVLFYIDRFPHEHFHRLFISGFVRI